MPAALLTVETARHAACWPNTKPREAGQARAPVVWPAGGCTPTLLATVAWLVASSAQAEVDPAASVSAVGSVTTTTTGTGTTPSSTAQLTGELRLHWDGRRANANGVLARAQTLLPSVNASTPNNLLAEAELRFAKPIQLSGVPVALAASTLAWQQQTAGGAAASKARFNELNASAELDFASITAGKKVLGWDVGYGFRPNDVVQQELRRNLLAVMPEGRPLIELEHFAGDTAATLVWVNPQRLNTHEANSRGAGESALAARFYQRQGAADWFAFGRLGTHTGASLGAALAWVASDSLELHASMRLLQRHDGWATTAGADSRVLASNPWQQTTLGAANQGLLGAQWTGAQQQSLLVEYWHDGNTLSDAQWRAWAQRNLGLMANPTGLAAPGAPASARGGNLAWQATPFDAVSLRRDNVLLRASWQPERWTLSFDALIQPADRGCISTAALQWQGERWRFNASLRHHGGPASALVRQLPLRQQALLAATASF